MAFTFRVSETAKIESQIYRIRYIIVISEIGFKLGCGEESLIESNKLLLACLIEIALFF